MSLTVRKRMFSANKKENTKPDHGIDKPLTENAKTDDFHKKTKSDFPVSGAEMAYNA